MAPKPAEPGAFAQALGLIIVTTGELGNRRAERVDERL